MSDRSADVTRSLPADPATLPHDPNATLSAETTSPVAPPDLPPNFVLVAEIGRGAMGVVYSARQLTLNRTVALKMVLAGAHASRQEVARFLTEVQAAAAVEHPNVVRVYESGEHRGTPYLAMEYVNGSTLAAKLDGKPMPHREAVELVAKVCDGVQASHSAGIVHRDLKPGNILLSADSTPKVADFGLAKRPGGSDLTHTGAILGTPGYMAPEQARGQGKAVGPSADVYALGAVLFHCLAGRPPFVGDDPIEVVLKVASDDPPSVAEFNRAVPRDLATIVAKCLRKVPAERYSNAGELADDLRRFLAGQLIVARRVRSRWFRGWRTWAIGLVVVGLSVAGWYTLRPPLPVDRNKKPGDGSKSIPADSISGDPRDIAVRFLNDAKLNPTNSSALKWTSPGFEFTWTNESTPRVVDRPYYQYTHATIDQTKQLDDTTIEYRGTVTAVDRVVAVGVGQSTLPTGGRAAYTLTVRANREVGAWRVDKFEFAERGSRAGPALLGEDELRDVVRETLNWPPEAFAKNTRAEVEEMIGLRSWVLFHCGGPTQFWLELEETGQQTIPAAELLARADQPYPSGQREGRVCLQFGRDLSQETLTPRDTVVLRMNRNFTHHRGLPCLWYHWKGAKLTEKYATEELGDGQEHTILTITAEETDHEKGVEPRKVVLRVLAKRMDKK